MEWSRDGRRLVAASADGTVHLWDVRSSALPLVIEGHDPGPASSAALSPDGDTLAIAWLSGLVEVCNAVTGERKVVIRQPDRPVAILQRGDSIAQRRPAQDDSERRPHVVYSPDGKKLLTVSPSGTVELWAADGSGLLASLQDSEPSPHWDASFSPDGASVVAAAENRTARVWSTDGKPEPGQVLAGHGGWVRTAAFSRDGSRVATASDDGSARVWSASSGTELVRLRGHKARVFGARFSPDGAALVSASEDGTARVWQLDAEEVVITASTQRVRTALYSADESYVLTASPDRTAKVWTMDGKRVVRSFAHPASVHCACFSPLAAKSRPHLKTALFGCGTCPNASPPLSLAAVMVGAAGSSTPLTACCSFFDEGRDRPSCRPSLISTIEPYVLSADDGSPVRSVSFSPDGRTLATGSDRGSIWVWDISRPAHAIWCMPEGHRTWITTVAFSRDGGRLVSASGDDTARIWDGASGTLLLELPHSGQESVRAACFSGDGKRVVTGTGDGVVSVWDGVGDGARLAVMRGHAGPVSSSVYSRDGLKFSRHQMTEPHASGVIEWPFRQGLAWAN